MTTPKPTRSAGRAGRPRAALVRREAREGRRAGRRRSRRRAPGRRGGGRRAPRAPGVPAAGDPRLRRRRSRCSWWRSILGLLVCGPLGAVPARAPLPRRPWRPPVAAVASPPPCRPSARRSRAAPDRRRRPQGPLAPVTATATASDPAPAAAWRRRDAADDHGRAVLRPRLRLRGHAAVAPDPRRPLRRRRRARRLPAAHRLVGVDLHDLDGQLVRPGHPPRRSEGCSRR